MSKASEEYVETLESVKESPDALMVTLSGERDEYPRLKEYMQHAAIRLIPAVLRPAKYYFAGSPPWSDGISAIKATMDRMDSDVKLIQLRHFATGVMVGSMEECDFSSAEFENQVLEKVLGVVEDHDLASEVTGNVPEIMAKASQRSNFLSCTGRETAHVWDLWNSVLKSNVVEMYTTGVKLGQRWREEEILNGILQVTSEGEQ